MVNRRQFIQSITAAAIVAAAPPSIAALQPAFRHTFGSLEELVAIVQRHLRAKSVTHALLDYNRMTGIAVELDDGRRHAVRLIGSPVDFLRMTGAQQSTLVAKIVETFEAWRAA